MKRYIQSFIELLFPRACVGCGTSLLRDEDLLCTACEIELPIHAQINQMENIITHVFSGRLPVLYANTFLEFSKNGVAQRIIHALKYQDREDVGFAFGYRFGQQISDQLPASVDVVVPVPLHPDKEKLRGYNQCMSIASGIAEALGAHVETDAVVRTWANPSQTRLNRAKRWQNVENIFAVENTFSLRNKHVLLVDDTLTTGATLESCGSEILKAKPAHLSIVTLAYAK